jgi:hypothetical protein
VARSPIYAEAKDAVGAVVPTGSMNVKIRATGANATLYNAETAGSTITNPVAADSLGRMLCWVDRGDYDAIISGTGISTYTLPVDASPAGDHDIDSTWYAANYVPTILTNTGSGTSPASPADGDRFLWIPALASVGPCEFRYRAASPSTYKWECVGGGGFTTNMHVAYTTTTLAAGVLKSLHTGWDDGITFPTFVAPFTGEYDVYTWAALTNSSGVNTYTAGLSINASSLNQGSGIHTMSTPGYAGNCVCWTRATVTAGDTLDARFSYASATTPQTIARSGAGIHITPARIL